MKLKEYIKQLQILEKKYGNLPLGYSSDSEGNSYSLVCNEPSPAQVEDNKAYYLEIIGFLDEKSIKEKDINCIIIN